MDISKSVAAFAALAQNTRLQTLRLLIAAGPEGLPAGTIAQRLDVRQNTLSSHLGSLAQAGLVASTRDGRSIRYSADFAGIESLLVFLLEDCCGANPEMCRPALSQIARLHSNLEKDTT